MKTKTQNKTFLTGFTPSTDAEILQRLEATKALLRTITDIRDVRTVIPDLEKWEQNEIEMKYTFEVIDISNLVRDWTGRLAGKYYQETGLKLSPIQEGSSLGIRVGWLRFVDIHLIGKESQIDAENIAAAVSRDSAAMQQERTATGLDKLSMEKMVETFCAGNKNLEVGRCIELVNAKLTMQGETRAEGSIRNAFHKQQKLLKNNSI